MWEPTSSCQHGNSLAVQEWVWHGCSRATIPSLKRPQSHEMTSQQKRSRCHHWALSLPLGHRILNPNWPTWPGTTNFIYLFKDVQLALRYKGYKARSILTGIWLCVCVSVCNYFASRGIKIKIQIAKRKQISEGLLTLHRTLASTCPHSGNPASSFQRPMPLALGQIVVSLLFAHESVIKNLDEHKPIRKTGEYICCISSSSLTPQEGLSKKVSLRTWRYFRDPNTIWTATISTVMIVKHCNKSKEAH